MTHSANTSESASTKQLWHDAVAKYQDPDLHRSLWQIANSFVPFFLLWGMMYLSLEFSYWITLALALPTAGFLVRVFIIFHDCGHGSFFKSRKANDRLGAICGILTLTPYQQWRHDHAVHHATAGDLDRRGVGDIFTLTVSEYLALSRWGRFKYWVYRHPLVLFGIGSMYIFLISQRFCSPHSRKRERYSVYGTNFVLLMIIIAMSLTIGLKSFLMIQLPISFLASTAGVWLFYVQHQFEETYWEHNGEWDYAAAALQGSSYYKLPKMLQWFSGNIGLHHIHHLSARIPNYNLQKCHDENPLFQKVKTITLWASVKASSLKLWDEERQRLIGFRQLKAIRVREDL
jgi:omega-6 fatty acid desaturase (delta-12 desaturase)